MSDFHKTRRRLSQGAILTLLLLPCACGVPGPNGSPESFGLDFSLPNGAKPRGAVVFVVDGVNARVFEEMLRDGKLPALQKHFVDRGLYIRRAVGNLPSVTLANLTTLATGQFPGHHGVVGTNWFDRTQQLRRDYNTIDQKNTLDGDYAAATIFEQFPEDMTVSIFFQAHRGTTKFFENRLSAVLPFHFGWYNFVDRLTLFRFGEMMGQARRREAPHFPVVTYAYLLNPDFQAYAHGVGSAEYRAALRHTDRQIGRVLGDLERAGLLDKLHVALVSDHGMGDVDRHFPLAPFLRDTLGLSVAPGRLWENTSPKRRRNYYANYSVVANVSGDRFAALSIRKPTDGNGEGAHRPWDVRPDAGDLLAYPTSNGEGKMNLPLRLLTEPAVDAVAWKTAPNRCRIRTREGQVEFDQPAGAKGPIAFYASGGRRSFAWKSRLPADVWEGKPWGQRKWLDATNETDFPDLPAQLLAYFRAPRSGDLAVFAAPGWTSTRPTTPGTVESDPRTICTFRCFWPARGCLTKPAPRPEPPTLVPTLLDLLGKEAAPNLDGQSLLQPAGENP